MKLRRMDRTGAYAIAARSLAMDDARQPRSDDGVDDSGVMLGTWTAGGQATQDYLSALFGPDRRRRRRCCSTAPSAMRPRAWSGARVQAARPERDRQLQRGIGAGGDCLGHRDDSRRARARWLPAAWTRSIEIFFKAYDRFHVMSPARTFSRACGAVRSRRAAVSCSARADSCCGWSRADRVRRAARRHGEILGAAASSAAVPLNAWPDVARAACRGRCASRSMTPGSSRAMSTSCTRPRMRRRRSIASRRGARRAVRRNRAW